MPSSPQAAPASKNPRRVLAGRTNVLKRAPWSLEAREAQRARCLASRPWTRSTGPRTAEGKLRAARNGKRFEVQPGSARQAKLAVASVRRLIAEIEALRLSALAES